MLRRAEGAGRGGAACPILDRTTRPKGRAPGGEVSHTGYVKGDEPNYRFPASGTVGFKGDYVCDGMTVLHVPEDLITDNDDARWPCFFPQSAGIITSRGLDGTANVMPAARPPW